MGGSDKQQNGDAQAPRQDPTGHETRTRTCPLRFDRHDGNSRIALPRHLTTGMTPWRFEGVPLLPNDRNNGCGRGYLACGEVAGWGEADGGGAAEPEVV